jgi:hypothetical protein
MKYDVATLIPWALVAAGTISGVYVLSAYTIDVKVKPKQSEADQQIEQARRQVVRTQGQLEARLDALRARASKTLGEVQEEIVPDDFVIPRRRP